MVTAIVSGEIPKYRTWTMEKMNQQFLKNWPHREIKCLMQFLVTKILLKVIIKLVGWVVCCCLGGGGSCLRPSAVINLFLLF